jgi:hypothetical protein
MIDIEGLRASVNLVDVVRGYGVDLRKAGAEWQGLCPFHDERSPSFTVNEAKGFVHCFGCGAHHDVIGFVMHASGLSFPEACKALGAQDVAALPAIKPRARKPPASVNSTEATWVPVYPVPDDAPAIEAGEWCRVWNAKRGKYWSMRPERADAYRDAHGRLMGYVVRLTFADGKKVTPQVTWCIGPDGSMRWCAWPFQKPRPLCGLDGLAELLVTIIDETGTRRKRMPPSARIAVSETSMVDDEHPPVLVVEGEKCRAAGAGALPMYAVVCWPGGSKGLRHVDWSPLKDRDVVLWPDADEPGWHAMLGHLQYEGTFVDGVAQYAHRVGCRSLRLVDPTGMPKGWDLADALDPERDHWTPKQLATWAALRVKDVEVCDRAVAA